jgi:hypothetical protein
MPSQVKLIGHDKNIRGAKVDQRTNIQTITEIGNYTDKVGNEYQQYELIKPDDLFPLGNGRLLSQAGINDILIEGFTG